jgi:diaminohydroxyphosphoribosylaminopyrimidine deaminase/5-amino-6-(5-phosphoribosylamino)uracil reductase
LESGVTRVVFGAADPGNISGGGGESLRAGGAEVVGPVWSVEEARRENPAFFFNQEKGATYVAIKLAQSLDGKIAEGPGRRTTITGPEAKTETHRLRAGFDGVLVGAETVRVDDPLLTVREDVPLRTQPARVILDTEGTLAGEARVFRDLPDAPVVVFIGEDVPQASENRLIEAGARVFRAPRDPKGLSLPSVLKTCWNADLRSLFCEGGGKLASELILRGLAQRLYLFVAPFVLGREGVPAFVGLDSREPWRDWAPAAASVAFGRDVLITLDRTC